MSEIEQATSPPPLVGGSVPQSDRTMALVAHLLGIVTWVFGALIIWLINKDAQPPKPFLVDQAKEALNFQITLAIADAIALTLVFLSFGILFFLPILVAILRTVFAIIAATKANDGEAYRYPFALRLIK